MYGALCVGMSDKLYKDSVLIESQSAVLSVIGLRSLSM